MPHGIIVCKHNINFDVEDPSGKIHLCSARKKAGLLVCGDHVIWQPLEAGKGVITDLEPRKNLLSRPDKRGTVKAIASNIDQLFIVVTTQPQLSLSLVDRYLVASELLSITPVIVLNKVDLIDDDTMQVIRKQLDVYESLGYRILFTSTKQDHGLDSLLAQLAGKTSIFVGQSGVGKSSLIQKILPEEKIRVGKLSDATGLGKHTTSSSRLYHIAAGGAIIDSPGIREFALWKAPVEDIQRGFREFLPYIGKCQFNDCQHATEPGCAISAASKQGDIDMSRLDSYHDIIASMIASRR